MSITRIAGRHWPRLAAMIGCLISSAAAPRLIVAQFPSQSIIHQVQPSNDRLELTVNSSRLLTLERPIPLVMVSNPDLLTVTPLGPKQVQVHAKKVGVTQINLTDDKNQIHTIDIIVYGDVKDLQNILEKNFPTSSLQVFPAGGDNAIIKGYVDNNESVATIMKVAQVYYPNVINNITVGGVQQVLLRVSVMEVSRTKLRDFGVDWAAVGNAGGSATSSVGGLIKSASATGVVTNNGSTFNFGIVNSNSHFFGVLAALQRNQLAKVLAEPTLTTVSGRPASFLVGGEIPILIPQSLGTVSIDYKRYGTQIDFVPIVLGNGIIRLEVRPQVSELDPSSSVVLNGNTIPGLKTRSVDTGAEMRAGQTLALAGLVQCRTEYTSSGVPWLKDIPFFGIPFRRQTGTDNEVELLIMVRPELVQPLDCHEVPPYGPGANSMIPKNCDFYIRGYTEVPRPGSLDGPTPAFDRAPFQPTPAAPANEQIPPGPSAKSNPRGDKAGSVVVRTDAPAPGPAAPATARAQTASMQTNVNATPAGRSNRANPQNRTTSQAPGADSGAPELIGSTGYDVKK